MGFDVNTFELILNSGFRDFWSTTTIQCTVVDVDGHPWLGCHSLDATGALGLVLHYLNSCMTQTSLQQIFGLVPTTVNPYILLSLQILDMTLLGMPDACIVWPNATQISQYSAMIVERHGLLQGAFGSIDGLKLPVEVPEDPMMENASFNSWTHGHYSNQILVFAPDGMSCLIIAW